MYFDCRYVQYIQQLEVYEATASMTFLERASHLYVRMLSSYLEKKNEETKFDIVEWSSHPVDPIDGLWVLDKGSEQCPGTRGKLRTRERGARNGDLLDRKDAAHICPLLGRFLGRQPLS